MRGYKELQVYKKGYKYVIEMYKITERLPEEEKYGLKSQIRRAAMSIPLTIAEGYGKDDTKAELKRFLRMAKGSAAELEVLIDICKDLGYMNKEEHDIYEKEAEEIGKMLHGLIKSID